jgi:hypothetical protein
MATAATAKTDKTKTNIIRYKFAADFYKF